MSCIDIFNFKRSVLLKTVVIFLVMCMVNMNVSAQTEDVRKQVSLNSSWLTVANDTNRNAYDGFEQISYDDQGWKKVDVPHNWDQYEGYRQMKHGNRHGYAWYRRSFKTDKKDKEKEHFLFFEGVGSYATVWVNGQKVGEHAGGRTTFTLNITEAIHFDKENIVAVRADHPAMITDLPWVCGGCSGEWGFSEGSQPMGIFRPVRLIITSPVRIEPFGVHIWNDNTVSKESASLNMNTELKNYGKLSKELTITSRLQTHDLQTLAETSSQVKLASGETYTVHQKMEGIPNPRLWSVEDPYLYTMVTEIREGDKVVDKVSTPYGIRWISWPANNSENSNQFFLNGKPVFLNGTCEYEHMMGKSHAFTDEQVLSRAKQMKAAGFNAFRDAHQPHNFLYHQFWDEEGILFWTQMSAHIWYDTPGFRKNFKVLLREWVKERRNSPSVVLWGLQNESTLPEDFARECTEIIRQMDPTASGQRLVTTCNGGTGTDWNVVQNWSGTYSGDPYKYDEELSSPMQLLNGEYGAWRSIDWHTEGPFEQKGPLSESRFTHLMEMKIALAEKVKDKVCGQFHWLYNSHENPGRIQNGEGLRAVDKVGPVNYKGLVTPWEEPLDAFYMYRSNYAPKDHEPMVYIASHTWPDRWAFPGVKDSISVYSNCDEVELFNDVRKISLGKRKKQGKGAHFQWDKVDIQYNVLYAIGYVNGKEVASDVVVLNHLPQAPNFKLLKTTAQPITAPTDKYHYLYRVNCGGPDYVDSEGNLWMADVNKTEEGTWGSVSWTNEFPGMPAFFASQRSTNDPISGTHDWPLFQSFRFGMDQLKYEFPVPDGEYLVELYFTEPWYGAGGGLDASGWRIFDVAVNGNSRLKDLDIWSEVGHDHALKKAFKTKIKGGKLEISFPKVKAGQAIISAIAISSKKKNLKPAPRSPLMVQGLKVYDKEDEKSWTIKTWLNTGEKQFSNDDAAFISLPSDLYTAEWIQAPKHFQHATADKIAEFSVRDDAHVYIAVHEHTSLPAWMNGYIDSESFIQNHKGQKFKVYQKEYKKGDTVYLGTLNGTLLTDADISKSRGDSYTIAVLPVTDMGEQPDPRPVMVYQAVDATLNGSGHEQGLYRDKPYIQFSGSGSNSIEWEVSPGLAGVYLLRFKYMNVAEKPIPMRIQIVAADGRLMRDDVIDFPPTPNKWKLLSTTSGQFINAGHYKVRLITEGIQGLELDSFEFQ